MVITFLQVNLTNANLEGATATGNTSFKGSNITGAGTKKKKKSFIIIIRTLSLLSLSFIQSL